MAAAATVGCRVYPAPRAALLVSGAQDFIIRCSTMWSPHVEPTSYICTRGPEGLKNQALIFRFLGLLRTFPNHFF